MRAQIVGEPAPVFLQPDPSAQPVRHVQVGEELELGSVVKGGGRDWVTVALPGGQQGYLPAESKVRSIKQVKLVQSTAKVYAEPSELSTVTRQLKKNERFYLFDTVSQNGKTWVRVRDPAGNPGYIENQTRVQVIVEPTREIAKKNMLRGAAWCIGGILVTAITYANASSGSGGGIYFIAWGPAIFGAWQFLKGVYQFLTTRPTGQIAKPAPAPVFAPAPLQASAQPSVLPATPGYISGPPKPAPAAEKTCRACSRMIPATAAFCPECGSSTAEPMLRCPACGQIQPAGKFCMVCGGKLTVT